MKEKIYKYSVITFLIINLITLYLFYDYLIEKPTMFYGIWLLINFLHLIVLSLGLGIILLLLRLFFHLSKKKNYLKTNFFYVFSGIFSFLYSYKFANLYLYGIITIQYRKRTNCFSINDNFGFYAV